LEGGKKHPNSILQILELWKYECMAPKANDK